MNETTLRLREYWPFPVDLVESFYYHTYQHYSANSTTLESRHRESTLFSALGSAQWDETGNCIVGHVTAENGKPLPGVKVYQRKYGSSSTDIQEPVLTDKNGFFLTDGHGSGNYIVSFNKKGYKSAYSPVHLETNEHGELKVTLQEKTAAETAAAAGKQKGAAGDDKYMLNGDREITCTIQQEDGSVIPGVWVGIFRRFSDGSSVKVDTAVSNEFGNVVFSRLQPGNYIVAPRVYGLKKICKEV
ncbi:MAG: carboxypeptidase regulatory-like domain-containing protein, partial [bacterium]|nr:carboxypeptidase regulatory-like domain-containing protein [bacterium]